MPARSASPNVHRGATLCACVSLLVANAANAGIYGEASVVSQLSTVESPGSPAKVQLTLAERLLLRGNWLPFDGRYVLLDGGASISRFDGFGMSPYGGFVIGWDASTGLLPTRSLPLTVYGGGAHTRGESGFGPFAATGRDRFVYGARLRIDEGKYYPSLRGQYEEQRGFQLRALEGRNEVRRTVDAGVAKRFGATQVQLNFRREDVDYGADFSYRRHLFGGAVIHPAFQTTLSGYETRGITPNTTPRGELNAALMHRHLVSRWLRLNANGAINYATLAGTEGLREVGSAGLTFIPLSGRDLFLDVEGGFAHGELRGVVDPAVTPTLTNGGSNQANAGLRAAYTQAIGPDRLLFGLGGRYSYIDGTLGASGHAVAVNGQLGGQLARVSRLRVQASYAPTLVFASALRGGNRVEHQANASIASEPTDKLSVAATVAYVDALRELYNLAAVREQQIHERSVAANLALSHAVWRGRVRADAGYQYGSSFNVVGALLVADLGLRHTVSGSAGIFLSPARGLSVETTLSASYAMAGALGAVLAITPAAAARYRVGYFSFDLEYSYLYTTASSAPSQLHRVMLSVSRPFEVAL